ncbi:hypothetical protein AQ490_08725 [Wenjunlia vitaminophila]|uniref:Uncharacterized protein n=1 Tax=Wenjunlia vitaminophila TaxID=76728 RepID=A0A0T6LLC3_WENVI|nr:hypothetical protein [Wenjunlia vitaminophila]KRV46858.1 hypothetical protein AQ490_08725 [Wenjunlia vitaminophila]
MKSHEFRPSHLVAGVVCLAVAVTYLLDASGLWQVPTVVGGNVFLLGMVAAAVTGTVHRSLRRRARDAD